MTCSYTSMFLLMMFSHLPRSLLKDYESMQTQSESVTLTMLTARGLSFRSASSPK